jgi:hypothetical protein
MKRIFLIGGLAFLAAQPAGALNFDSNFTVAQTKGNSHSWWGAMPPKPAPDKHTPGLPSGRISVTLPPVPIPPSRDGTPPGCRVKPFGCVGSPAPGSHRSRLTGGTRTIFDFGDR